MEPPTVSKKVYDPGTHVRWEVMAYRELSDEEAVGVIRTWLSSTKKKNHPKRGEHITIVTVLGAGDNFFG